jgi:hypothetical protein
MTRLDWQHVILPHARDIALSYDTRVTLRQLFYRLVADGSVPNIRSSYQRFSSYSAEWRRRGTFPALYDKESRVEQHITFTGADDAMQYLIEDLYRRDRTEGQDWNIYLGVEKAGLYEQLDSWFGDPLGMPIIPLAATHPNH